MICISIPVRKVLLLTVERIMFCLINCKPFERILTVSSCIFCIAVSCRKVTLTSDITSLYSPILSDTLKFLIMITEPSHKLARNLLTWFLQITACTKVPCYMLIRKWIPNNQTIQQCRIT